MKKKTLIAGGLTLSILSGGFALGANIPTDNVSAASNTSSAVEKSDAEKGKENEASEQSQLKKEVKVSSQDAEKAALNEVDGTVLDTELGDENGTIVYEITLDTKNGNQEVKVDATSGEFLKVENDNEEENGDDDNVEYEDGDKEEDQKENEASEQAQLKKEVKVSSQDAEKVALNEVDGKVVESELGDENGTIVYEITIETQDGKQEVKVDATSGEFLKVENDNDEENDDDENDEREDEDQDDDQQKSENDEENK